jgi:Secretion system C-terminal sorting domain
LHVDVWTNANPANTTLQVSPINNGTGAGETLVTINYTQGSWYSVNIPKSAFTGMTWNSVFQMKFAANGPGSTVPVDIYLDNVYFWKAPTAAGSDATLSDLKVDGNTVAGFGAGVISYNIDLPNGTTIIPQITSATTTDVAATKVITQATALPGIATVVVTSQNTSVTKTYTVNYAVVGPPFAAPTPPARPAADVKSIFSDAYTPITFDNFDAGWCGGAGSNLVQIAGNNTLRKNPGVICQGIDFQSNRLNLTDFTYIHFDFYISDTDLTGDVFNVKLINFNGTNAETSALEININGGSTPQLVANQWVSVDVPITTLGGVIANSLARNDVAQVGITTAMVDNVWYDNIYLHKNTILSTDVFEVAKVKLFPNPAKNVLNIESVSTIEKVAVYNVLGQQVISEIPNTTVVTLDVSNLQVGVYVVKTTIDGNVSSSKFIKE